MQNPPGGAGEDRERFVYFMIRTHSGAGEGPENLSGIMERLGSGRKQRFSGAEELVRLLTTRPDAPANMGVAEEPRND